MNGALQVKVLAGLILYTHDYSMQVEIVFTAVFLIVGMARIRFE